MYSNALYVLLQCFAAAGVITQDQSGSPGCEAEALDDDLSLLQTRMDDMLPHDNSVNECDHTKPEPPHVGIWTGRFAYPKEAKVIVDIGGNVGDDVHFFLQKHPRARIFTFEPVPELFQKLQSRFATHSNVLVQNFGLSHHNAQKEFVLEGVAGIGTTGLDHSVSGKHVQVQLRDVDEVLSWVQRQTGQVPDLLSMNCEGCEYDVLQRMVGTGWLRILPNIQLSWHVAGDVKDRVNKKCAIEKRLWLSHTRKFKSGFGWVGWQRN